MTCQVARTMNNSEKDISSWAVCIQVANSSILSVTLQIEGFAQLKKDPKESNLIPPQKTEA
eukprot:35202-Amphidinium_carterae.1